MKANHIYEYSQKALSERAETMSDLSRKLDMNRSYLSSMLNHPDAPPACPDGWPVAAIRRYRHHRAGRVEGLDEIAANALPWLAVLHAELIGMPREWLKPHEAALLDALETVIPLYPKLIGYTLADVVEDALIRDEILSEK